MWEGQSLAQKMTGQPLDLRELLDIGTQAADALEEAHRKGITHRDIKSANLMITPKGQVKVLDFGLAKISRPEGEAAGSDVSTSIHTAPGMVMGTLLLHESGAGAGEGNWMLGQTCSVSVWCCTR